MLPLTSDTGDTTHISLARMNHRGLEKQLFDEYYCLCHILQYNSWQQCCQFFLALEKLLRYSFVQRLNVIWPSLSRIWRHFLLAGVSLTPSVIIVSLILGSHSLLKLIFQQTYSLFILPRWCLGQGGFLLSSGSGEGPWSACSPLRVCLSLI